MHITKHAKNLIKIQSKIKLKSEAEYVINRKAKTLIEQNFIQKTKHVKNIEFNERRKEVKMRERKKLVQRE